MNTWDKPTFIEVDMSAEIGGYQGDDSGEWPNGPDHMPDFVKEAEQTAR
jgi:hypothetical protein